MAKSRFIKGYKIARHYSSCTVWIFAGKTRALLGTLRVVPRKDASPREKFKAIADCLKAEKIPVPVFRDWRKKFYKK